MKLVLWIIFSALFSFAFAENNGKEVLSKEAEYEKLAKDSDYWINSPIIMDDSIVFYFKDQAKKVRVAGDFNGWKLDVGMELKSTNFWQASWEKRLKKGVYKYKLVVDDIWINDPFNTNTITDDSGQLVSFFELTEDFIPHAKYPLWLEKDYYLFKYKDDGASAVNLVGDFNNWDPYSLKMENKGAGEFEIKIRLKPGKHIYCFVADNEWKTDPNNLKQFSDEVGNIVNVLDTADTNDIAKPKKHY